MTEESALTTTSTKSVLPYSSPESFESAQLMAQSLAESDIVPSLYKRKLGNCIIALEIATRMGMSPFQVMQNLDVINGNPSWRSQFIIALIQGSDRFEGFTYNETPDSCQCLATLKTTGEQVSGTKITMDMAKREGWTRNTKWSTMPQTMLRYRAASAFGRFYIPDLILGIRSVEENEVIEAKVQVVPESPESKLDTVSKILAPKAEPQPVLDQSPPLEPDDDFFAT